MSLAEVLVEIENYVAAGVVTGGYSSVKKRLLHLQWTGDFERKY